MPVADALVIEPKGSLVRLPPAVSLKTMPK